MGHCFSLSPLFLLLGLLVVPLAMAGHDYGQALSKSILFFEAQRSGYLPSNQRVHWRGNSGLADGKLNGVDLVGGYYDAGDNVKFGLPMAFTVTMMSWSIIEYGTQIGSSGELRNALDAVKWGTDYLIKAHPEPNVLYGEIDCYTTFSKRKIEIKKIEEKPRRYTTFSKRRDGLFKKTIQLCTKYDFSGTAIAITSAGNVFGKAHPHVNTVLARYYADLYSEENEVVEENNSSSVDRVTDEMLEMVSDGMKQKAVELAMKNIKFTGLDGLEKVFKCAIEDTAARRRETELNVKDGHAD